MNRIIPFVFLLASAVSASAAEPVGEWVVEDGSARIKIDRCGESLWGVLSWEKSPGRDQNNPDPSKRNRPTLGLPILLNMQPASEGWKGEVYNAQNGKTYDSNIRLSGADALKIEGCVLGFLCGGETWTRYRNVSADVPPPPPRRMQGTVGTVGEARPQGIDVCSSVGVTGRPHERRLK